jgi:aryl-alcohol dehydrogenase-like predicted oxidoreductase
VRGDEWERTHAVERALELGINYFDTASTYGKGMSESNLGAALLQEQQSGIGCHQESVCCGIEWR